MLDATTTGPDIFATTPSEDSDIPPREGIATGCCCDAAGFEGTQEGGGGGCPEVEEERKALEPLEEGEEDDLGGAGALTLTLTRTRTLTLTLTETPTVMHYASFRLLHPTS